jgi:hypothetical protein
LILGLYFYPAFAAREFLFLSVAFGLYFQTGHKSIPFSKARQI